MRVAVVADIGQPVYHVGDEAIGHATAEELAARGVEVVLFTRDVAHTRAHFGDVEAVPALEFPHLPAARERRLAVIEAFLAGESDAVAADDPVHGVLDILSGVDALLVAGGGNLNSAYGWLLYERAALALSADHLAKPVGLVGQTLGPVLTDQDRTLLTRMLGLCRLVLVREAASLAVAHTLVPDHPALALALDDAAPWRRAQHTSPPHGSVLATFAPALGWLPHDEGVHLLAALLDTFAQLTDTTVDLLPHMSTPGVCDGDVAFHRDLAAASTSGRVRELPLPTASEAADAVARAALVLTSRYHPAVFAAARGVATAALVPDVYADVRIDGALANHGMTGWTIPLEEVRSGRALAAALAVWRDRQRIRTHLDAHATALFGAQARRWDAVVTALAGGDPVLEPLPIPEPLAPPAAVTVSRRILIPELHRRLAGEVDWHEENRLTAPDLPPTGSAPAAG